MGFEKRVPVARRVKMNRARIIKYIEDNIGSFHQARLNSLQTLKIDEVLKKKNPYLFKAKNILTAQDLLKGILDAHLSSQEETMFGSFLERLAIFICEQHGGKKSAAEGIDLELKKDGIHYIVSIKSGPNWGNSAQINKLKTDFIKAKKVLRTNNPKINVVAINGCCYGRDNKPDKGEYFKYCGQRFWEFISGDENLYTEIIEPLGHKAKEKNQKFLESYAQVLNKFTFEFTQKFCVDGKIDWKKLVRFNSSKHPSTMLKH
jgi:hypothetical protein